MDKDSSSDSADLSVFRRIIDFLGLNRKPDTTEDLEQEIQELIEEGEEQGLITTEEGQMINSIFEFRETLAHEIMTPLSDIACADVTSSITDIIELITEKGFTRIPVYSKTTDHILGILHAKDLLSCKDQPGEEIHIRDILMPAYFVLENKRIVDLLRDFQAGKVHMAIVTDEFGGVRGLITLEDILEEIVGEIDDEYDKPEKRWRELEDGSLLIYAKVDIEEVENYYKTTFPEGPYESIGGLIINQLGRVPEIGESVDIETLNFKVLSATKRHIKTLQISRK